MKTITIILAALFVLVIIFLSIALIKQAMSSKEVTEVTSDTTPVTESSPIETTAQVTHETVEETVVETFNQSDENINKIEIYLDGNKENGIFLGEAEYNIPSEDAALIYGKDFSNFGFELLSDNKDLNFEPGSIHTIYIYTYIPALDWDYTRNEIIVPGNPEVSETIKMSLESPNPNEPLDEENLKEVNIKGWAVDLSVSENTGINKVEVYLEGPRNFGKFLGEAQFGFERVDVGNAFGDANYNNSGYALTYDASDLEPGSTYRLYVYAYSITGGFSYLTTNITVGGDQVEKNTIIKADANFNEDNLEISGWAINKDFIEEGVPRSADIEYSMKKIVFVSSQTGNKDIWSMNLDGSELKQLTSEQRNDMYPSISPDGKKIVYAIEVGNTWQIATMNWNGSDKKQITSFSTRAGYPSWTFDGRYIFFEMYLDENWEICVMESDGSNVKQLTSGHGEYNWHPNAHPFKDKVVYEIGAEGKEIWEIDINGDNKNRISQKGRNYRVPKYSIDAEKIVFMGYDDNGKEQIFVMDSDGDDVEQLTDTPDQARLPCFSPDNRYIVFNTKGGGSEIFIMDADGSDARQLTNFPSEDDVAVFMYQVAE